MKAVKFSLGILGLALVVSLVLLGGVKAQDTDSDNTSFNVTLSNTVDIDIIAPFPAAKTVTRADLANRYFTLDPVVFEVRTITNYNVTAQNARSSTLQAQVTGELTDALIEIQILQQSTTPPTPSGFSPYPDDGADDPVSSVTLWTDVPVSTTVQIMTGGNTMGGTDETLTTVAALRLDLDALGNNIINNVYTFTITLTVTET